MKGRGGGSRRRAGRRAPASGIASRNRRPAALPPERTDTARGLQPAERPDRKPPRSSRRAGRTCHHAGESPTRPPRQTRSPAPGCRGPRQSGRGSRTAPAPTRPPRGREKHRRRRPPPAGGHGSWWPPRARRTARPERRAGPDRPVRRSWPGVNRSGPFQVGRQTPRRGRARRARCGLPSSARLWRWRFETSPAGPPWDRPGRLAPAPRRPPGPRKLRRGAPASSDRSTTASVSRATTSAGRRLLAHGMCSPEDARSPARAASLQSFFPTGAFEGQQLRELGGTNDDTAHCRTSADRLMLPWMPCWASSRYCHRLDRIIYRRASCRSRFDPGRRRDEGAARAHSLPCGARRRRQAASHAASTR